MNMKGRFISVCISVVVTLLLSAGTASPAKIKDLAYFLGTRSNALIGYGLVVGLNGSGDNTNTIFTVNSLANMLENMGIHVDPALTKTKNVAAVMVTAKLPPFPVLARVSTSKPLRLATPRASKEARFS